MTFLNNKIIILLVFLLIINSSLNAQDDEQAELPDEVSLFLKTLALDIESADYYELFSWCESLGIESTGGVDTLKNRLYNFYKVSADSSEEEKSGDVIIIKSANNSEYFTIEEVDEDYLVLQGDVILEFRADESADDESERTSTHIVEAQRVVINQTKRILTATGDIKYTLIHENSDDEPEIFYGNTFTFNIDTWNGIFIQGGGETTREVEEGEEVNFYYVGETLTRLENDIVLLEEGLVTSCDEVDDPHWQIKASKMWVLSPGEWAITNGVFYVGRVPILYIPFFFKSGDEVFFHPSFGYKQEEGIFIQTTTYIMGQKQTDTSSFSFLRETGYDNEDYEMDIQGLFLRRGDKKEETDEVEYVLKLALDYYTRLGFFTGVGFFPQAFAVEDESPPSNYFAIKSGLGVSRSIFPTDTGAYSPYTNDEVKSYWHYINYFGLEIPIRMGLKTKFNFNKTPLTLNGQLEFYSDPFFTEDFYDREEEFNWDRFLNREVEEGAEQDYVNIWDFYPETNSNLIWEITSGLNFSFPNKYLKTLNITNMSYYMYWNSKADAGMTGGTDSYEPAREFFVPTTLKFPNNTRINLSGEILHLPFSRLNNNEAGDNETEDEITEDPGMGIHIPESGEKVSEEDGEAEEKREIEFRGIEIKGDEPGAGIISKDTTFTLSYNIISSFLIESQFYHENWESQDDVDFEVKYSNFTNTSSAELISDLNIWNSLVTVRSNTKFISAYRKHLIDRGVTPEEKLAHLESDYKSSSFDLNENFSLTVFPLKYTEYFLQSNINYVLDWDFYKYKFDRMAGENPVYSKDIFEWTEENIKQHKLNNSFMFSPNGVNYAKFNMNLPPEYGNYDWLLNYKLDFYFWNLNTYAECGYMETSEDEWEFKDLYTEETFNAGSWVNLKASSRWDLNQQEWKTANITAKFFNFDIFGNSYFITQSLDFVPVDKHLDKSVSTITFRDFSSSFTAERLIPIELNETKDAWINSGLHEEFQPKLLTFSYSHTSNPLYLWKNRVIFSLNFGSAWNVNLYKFTDSSLTFNLDFNFNIFEFLEFNFGMSSYNNYSYRYIRTFAEEADEPWVNPLLDILKSLNIFNRDSRYESDFKLKTLYFDFVHHLHDWDLTFKYSGTQKEVTNNNERVWEWTPGFSIILEWKPIPEIKHKVFKEEDDDDITFRG